MFSIVCNSTIAASMIFHLVRKNTGLTDTNLIFTRILRIAVESGLFCAVFAVLQLVLFQVYKHNNFNLAPSIALSKLYSNSLLMVLPSSLCWVYDLMVIPCPGIELSGALCRRAIQSRTRHSRRIEWDFSCIRTARHPNQQRC